MKVKKLFTKAEAFLNSDNRKRKEKKRCLNHVLSKLSKYEKKLNARLQYEVDEEVIAKLKRKLALAQAQHKKGLFIMKELG